MRGGKLILGVHDKIPRKVVGTSAFQNINKLKKDIFDTIHRRVNVEEINYKKQRAIILSIPPRPIGEALEFREKFLMRVGDSLQPMGSSNLKKIINEAISDYSSTIIKEASFGDLAPEAIKELRKLLNQSERIEKKDISSLNDKQLLTDLGLLYKGGITIASLILLGTGGSLKKFLPHAEIRYGYKIEENEIRNQDTVIYTGGYLLFYNQLWKKIDSRNLSLSIPQELRVLEKKAFEGETIREAVNNAIIHRDYSESETILIIQTRKKISITSPGGLLKGITIENMIDETKTRNKLIADVLFKCDFVEQFGNGVNLMVKNQLSSGKELPDYNKTDQHHVILKIDGTIQDIEFAKYVYLVASKKQKLLNDQELLILNKIKNGERVESENITQNLLDLGIIQSIGRNKYILLKSYYRKMAKRGEYTRRIGLDKETNKKLLLTYLKKWKKGYMEEFMEVLKGTVIKPTINSYLAELRDEGKIILEGNPRIVRGKNRAYWRLK